MEIGTKENLEKKYCKLKQTFNEIRKYHPSIKFIYLTYEEAVYTVKKRLYSILEENS